MCLLEAISAGTKEVIRVSKYAEVIRYYLPDICEGAVIVEPCR